MELPDSSNASSRPDEDISPVRAKMANLSSRSSFASFFCKTKRPSSSSSSQPPKIKPDPHRNEQAELGMISKDGIQYVDEEISFNFKRKKREIPQEIEITDMPKEIEITNKVNAPKPQEDSILISDGSSDSDDVKIISSTTKPRIDEEVISISSDDQEILSVRPLTRTKFAQLSDYTNIQKFNFNRPQVSTQVPQNLVFFNEDGRTTIMEKSKSETSKNASSTAPLTRTPDTAKLLTAKQPVCSSFLVDGFKDLDPSLREEMLARISQKSQIKIEKLKESFESKSEVETPIPTSIASVTNESVITFKVVQRLNVGSFDAKKSHTGQLLPSTNFIVYWKSSDTFGALKQRIASTLKVSPFDLILVNGHDDMELFDSTRPSTIKLVGLNLQEYANRQQQQQLAPGPTKKPRKNAKTTKEQQKNALASALQNLHASPPVTLYLYTKATYGHYKTIQQTKRKQVYDSLTFLQTAEEEMFKLTQNDQDVYDLDMTVLPLEKAEEVSDAISLKVKTALNKNQTYSIQVPISSIISDILRIFAAQFNQRNGTRVIFDGEVLRNDSQVDGQLEDGDMIEIK